MGNYIKRTVEQLLQIDTKERVIEFIQELCAHTGDNIEKTRLEELVGEYYCNNPVYYFDMEETEDSDDKKIMSWIDCIEFLQKAFCDREGIENVKICFEYHTPDDNWIDVILLDSDRLTILEFKSGTSNKNMEEYESQVEGYYEKIVHSNRNVWKRFSDGFRVEKYLIYTKEEMMSYIDPKKEFIKVGAQFGNDVVPKLRGMMEDSVEEDVMEFDELWDSSTLGAFISLLEGRLMKDIYKPEECIEYCKNIIENEKDIKEAKVNAIFVNGKPGAGKTGVGLSLLAEYLKKDKQFQIKAKEELEKEIDKVEQEKRKELEEKIKRVDQEIAQLKEGGLKIKYATGNGNLFELFNDACTNSKTQGVTKQKISRISFLYDEKKIVKNYPDLDKYVCKTKADIIVIDEAQRMWSPEGIVFRGKTKKNNDVWEYVFDKSDDEWRNNILKNDLSEPLMMLLDVYKYAQQEKKMVNVIFLIGSGQEISKGEESGEGQIYLALERVSDLFKGVVNSTVYTSTKEVTINDEEVDVMNFFSNSKVVIDDSLYLKVERRNLDGVNSGQIINNLLDNVFHEKDAGMVDINAAIRVYDINDFNEKIQHRDLSKRSRLFVASFEKNLNGYVGDNFVTRGIDNKKQNEGQDENHSELYEFFCENLGREYEVYATEFDAQGLEVDEVIFIWSDYIKWDKGRGKWIINDGAAWSLNKYYEALKKYQEKYPEISIKSLSI